MVNDIIFSWAENAAGKIVHVNDVPRGLQCDCYCPYCHEKLKARHGHVREHGFAHYSNTRGSNLKICYMVILYKLAEQLIQTNKKIHAPSYFGIFPEKDIEFVEVNIDSSYEREDKQPDVIAKTADGKGYLIEFVFTYKVLHKKAFNHNHLTCLEIDLSHQTLETLEAFLFESSDDRKWINNEIYFAGIKNKYAQVNKNVRVVEESECLSCKLFKSCCGVKTTKISNIPLVIENNGRKYRICKLELLAIELEKIKQCTLDVEQRDKDLEGQNQEKIKENRVQRDNNQLILDEHDSMRDYSVRSCFDCSVNLSWANRGDGYANCGAWMSLGVPKKTPQTYAQTCKRFKRKQ